MGIWGSPVVWEALADFGEILSRLHRLRALPNHGIQILPATTIAVFTGLKALAQRV